MGDQIVEPVTIFTYLSSDVHSDGYSTPEIRRRLGMASSIMGQLETAETQPADKACTQLFIPCPIRTLVRIRDLDTTQNRQQRHST